MVVSLLPQTCLMEKMYMTVYWYLGESRSKVGPVCGSTSKQPAAIGAPVIEAKLLLAIDAQLLQQWLLLLPSW